MQLSRLTLNHKNTKNGEMSHLNFFQKKLLIKKVLIRQSSNLNSIPYEAFKGCTKLKSVHFEIEDGSTCTNENTNTRSRNRRRITTIGGYAFKNCKSLQSISNIPNSVETIGLHAFHGCTSLQSIDIPNGVTTIGVSAFRGCTSLRSIDIPNSVTTIGEWAFKDCESLESILIPNSVTTIGRDAFQGCSSLQQEGEIQIICNHGAAEDSFSGVTDEEDSI